MGYVIQQAGLFPHRTVLDNIATVPRLLGWDKKKTRDRSRELLERVGLAPELGERYPAQLSGGQQQRVGVARALAADPPVLLMDEPFGAVDPVVREQLQDEFLRLQDELGKTIVFVTHDIDEAINLGDQVAVLRVGGRLAQMAAPADLLAHPADEFVADFLGRDRGYRALGFQERRGSRCTRSRPSCSVNAPTARMPGGSSSSTTTGSRWAGSNHAHRGPAGDRGRPAPWRHRRRANTVLCVRRSTPPVVAEPSGRDRRRRRGAGRHRARPRSAHRDRATERPERDGRPGARRRCRGAPRRGGA